MARNEVFKVFRMTISSGTGESRLRQAVLVHFSEPESGDAWSNDPSPTLTMVETAIGGLKKWITEKCPERTDWTVLPFETFYNWPSDDEG